MKAGFLKYLMKRALLGVVTLLVILFATYALSRLAPGDPAKGTMLGEGSSSLSAEKPDLAVNLSLREKLHLDKPVWKGFLLWGKGVVSGDFGESASVDRGKPVSGLILERLPVTLSLNFFAILVTYLLAIPIGIFSALKPESKTELGVTLLLFLLFSMPVVWASLMLQALFCQGGVYGIFPLKGLFPESVAGVSTWSLIGETAMHFILPVFCLSYASFAGLARFTRNGMLDVLHSDCIRTARAKGATEFSVVFLHAFRNALITMITLFASILPALAGGSILIEYVFNIPGMGLLYMVALSSRDIPLMMGLFGFGSVLTLTGILLSDILYVAADPRIDFESRI